MDNENNNSDFKEFDDLSEKIYVEFSIEGVVITTKEEANKVRKEISEILKKAFEEYDTNRINVQVSSFSEADIALSIMQNTSLFRMMNIKFLNKFC